MFELIMSCSLHCTGLPRFARNDEAHTRHCEERKRRGNPEMEKKTGFTLIELLVSLIIISIITSAFVPILSKKLKHREISYSAVKQMKIDCSTFDSEHGTCLLCDENNCNLCTSSINIPNGYYVDPIVSCNRQECSTPFPNCKRCTKAGCQECDNGYTIETNGTCSQVKCNKGYHVSGSSCLPCSDGQYQPNDNSTSTSCTSCSSLHANCSSCNATTGCCSACSGDYHISGCGCVYNIPTCTGSQYLDTTSNTCNNCSSFDSNCTTCTSSGCSTCKSGYKLKNKKCYKIPSSQTECDRFGAFYYDGLCITKRNAGDDGGPSISTATHTVTVKYAGSSCSGSYCCYRGKPDSDGGTVNNKTALIGDSETKRNCSATSALGSIITTNGSSFDYPACNRTVCKWYAADAICAGYTVATTKAGDWRLPSEAEINKWAANSAKVSVGLGANGLQLCDYNKDAHSKSSVKSPVCYFSGNCLGASNDICYPYHIWGQQRNGTQAHNGLLNYNSFFWTDSNSTFSDTASVRCVLDAYLE